MEDDSTEPPFHTDADHREFVSAGAAAGLAVGSLYFSAYKSAQTFDTVYFLRFSPR